MMSIIVTLFPEYIHFGSPGNIELASGVTLTGDTKIIIFMVLYLVMAQ